MNFATAAGNNKGQGQRSADAETGQRTNRKQVELLLKPQNLDTDEGPSSVWELHHHSGGCPESYGPFINQCWLFTVWNKALHRLGLES